MVGRLHMGLFKICKIVFSPFLNFLNIKIFEIINISVIYFGV
jgi:hypothetical protein